MDEEETALPKRARFRAYTYDDPANTKLDVQIVYGQNVRLFIQIEDTDEAEQDLRDLLGSVPKILTTCRGESQVYREMSGVDKELTDLLGDDE